MNTATNSPPVFLVCGYNDRPDILEGLASVYLKFKQLKVPAELHIYAGSGHGFGLRANDPKPAGKWIERFEEEDASRDRRAYRLTPLGRSSLKLEFERMKQLTKLASLRISRKKA